MKDAADPRPALFIYTRYPARTETFLRRERRAFLEQGRPLAALALTGSGGDDGVWRPGPARWASLVWRAPWILATRWKAVAPVLAAAVSRRPPTLTSLLENLAGMAAAVMWHGAVRELRPRGIHAAWAGGPACAAWLLSRLTGTPWTTGAHAYDLFEGGGDWMLTDKLKAAAGVHASTGAAARRAVERGAGSGRVAVVRRGLIDPGAPRAVRSPRAPLRVLSVARFVPKKGHERQVAILSAARAAGLDVVARLVGDGPMLSKVRRDVVAAGLEAHVVLPGAVDEPGVAEALAWADVLVHTGVTAPDGDRDGLPNVIGEALAEGVVVVASPQPGITEVLCDGREVLLRDPDDAPAWVAALAAVARDDALVRGLVAAGRSWVEREFDARINATRLWEHLGRCWEAAAT